MGPTHLGPPEAVVRVADVVHTFGDVRALDGVSLAFEPGIVYGLLGPNGAGKTTLIRVLSTLLVPDAGRVEVAGIDVLADPTAARARIGLSDAADRQVGTYFGGMRRRLDLAASLVGRPQVMFLDEPTTGIDPRNRKELWELVEDLVASGTTVLLTTQYLEEADRLAGRIAVIHHGRIITEGSAEELKDTLGGAVLELTTTSADRSDAMGAWTPSARTNRCTTTHTHVSASPRARALARSSRRSAPSTGRGSNPPTSPCTSRRSTTCSCR